MSKKGRKSPGSGRKKTTVAEKLSKIPFDLEKVRKIAAFYGSTDIQLASILEVSEDTINVWKKDATFLQALKAGKDQADNDVVKSLYARALGYECEVEKAVVVSDGRDNGSHVEIVKVKEKYPPDATSMIFWLKNRDKDNWRDRHDFTTDGQALKAGTIIINGKTITQD